MSCAIVLILMLLMRNKLLSLICPISAIDHSYENSGYDYCCNFMKKREGGGGGGGGVHEVLKTNCMITSLGICVTISVTLMFVFQIYFCSDPILQLFDFVRHIKFCKSVP